MLVTALKTFDHNGRKNRGQIFEVSEQHAKALKRCKLVSYTEETPENPSMTDCTLPSALLPVPPLTADDCELVRQWKLNYEKETGAQKETAVIVVNTTYQIAPWSDILYAMDRNWWNKYLDKVKAEFQGLRMSPLSGIAGVNKVKFNHYQNSGVGAISLAFHLGAQRVILLGYDCQKTGGKAHWHGDHPKGLGNAGSIATWPGQFARLAKDLAGKVDIVNCSRETALTMFERKPLEEVLNGRYQP